MLFSAEINEPWSRSLISILTHGEIARDDVACVLKVTSMAVTRGDSARSGACLPLDELVPPLGTAEQRRSPCRSTATYPHRYWPQPAGAPSVADPAPSWARCPRRCLGRNDARLPLSAWR